MHTFKQHVTGLLFFMFALTLLSCKEPAQNSNAQQSTNQQGTKQAQWVPQFRSEYSKNAAGTHLALYTYTSVSALSPSVVFAAGDMPNPKRTDSRVAVVIRTTDGGKTWQEKIVEPQGFTLERLNAIHFVNERVGWAVGAESATFGVLLKTTDGGETWSASRIKYRQTPTSVFFADENNGWMSGTTPVPEEDEEDGGPSDILATTDGGATWISQRRVPVTINDLFFLDKKTGWAAGYKGAIYHTTDGGQTWETQRSELEPGDGPMNPASEGAKEFQITGIHFIDAQNGFAAADSLNENAGRVLVTNNGGKVWSRRLIVGDSGVTDVHLVSPLEGFALAKNGRYIYHTLNGGQHWFSESLKFEQFPPLLRLGAAGPNHVWVAAGGAVFFRVAE